MNTTTLPTGPMVGPAMQVPPAEVVPVAAPPQPAMTRNVMIVDNDVFIPEWVNDLASFRRWSLSDEFPYHGRIEYINDTIWVDMTLEDLFSHVRVKGAITVAFGNLLEESNIGEFYPDGARIVHPKSKLSCEPDGTFVTWETQRSMKVQYIETKPGRVMELEGTPDIVIEVLSDGSVKKDIMLGSERYWKAGIPEFWLIDVRNSALRFDLNCFAKKSYKPAPEQDGWLRSSVLNKEIRLTVTTNPVGRPQYRLEMR